ncbi:MAG: hypothetical protein WD069_06860 [Planctomycetales bacterium]
MGRLFVRPGWLLLAIVVCAAATGAGLLAVSSGRQRAAAELVERLGGRCLAKSSAPEWSRKLLPESWLRPFDSIEHVDLSRARVADEDIPELVRRLERLPELRRLFLQGTKVGDASAADISRLTQLRALALDDTDLTDAGLTRLAPLERLEWLALGETRITDRGLEHLAAFPRLEVLDLDGAAITDAGIAALERLPRLTELSVANTGVTEAALRDLGSSLPSLTSVWDD